MLLRAYLCLCITHRMQLLCCFSVILSLSISFYSSTRMKEKESQQVREIIDCFSGEHSCNPLYLYHVQPLAFTRKAINRTSAIRAPSGWRYTVHTKGSKNGKTNAHSSVARTSYHHYMSLIASFCRVWTLHFFSWTQARRTLHWRQSFRFIAGTWCIADHGFCSRTWLLFCF